MVAEQVSAKRPELRLSPLVLERLRYVRDEAGFMATSSDEVHSSHTLLRRFHYLGGLSTHLAGIEAQSGPESPRAVIHRYAAYATKAWADIYKLKELQKEWELARYKDAAPGLSLEELGLQTQRPYTGVIDGGGQLIRYRDLELISKGGTSGVQPFMPKSRASPAADPYTIARPDRAMNVYMETELDQLRLGEAQRLLGAAALDQDARFAFWATCLETPDLLDRLDQRQAVREYAAGQ